MTAGTIQSDPSIDRMAVDERKTRSRSSGRTGRSSPEDAPADELNATSSLKSKQSVNSNTRSIPIISSSGTIDSTPSIYRTYSNKDKLQCEYFKEDQKLTDGELPSLTLPIRRTASNVSSTSSVSSIRARRLSPNSKNKHRAFWNQLNVEDDSEDDEGKIVRSRTPRNKKRNTPIVDDDNEEESGFMSVILNICSAFGSPEESVAPPSKGITNTKSDSNPIKKRNFSSKDDITDSDEDSASTKPTGKILVPNKAKSRRIPSSSSTYDEDENTAIEVEYVHPHYDDENSVSSGQKKFLQLEESGQVASYISREKKREDVDATTGASSANDKNAYLRALTSKAKEDFQRKKGMPPDQIPSENNMNGNIDWTRPEFEGWSYSDRGRYIELLQTNSHKDAVAIIASSQILPVDPNDADPANMNLPIMYSTIDEDRDSIIASRSMVSELSMSSAAVRGKKSAPYSSIKDSQSKPRGIILNDIAQQQRFDDRVSDTSNSERNIKLASNLLSNLTKRKDAQWMEIQENMDEEIKDLLRVEGAENREQQNPLRDEARTPSLSIQIKDPDLQVSSTIMPKITLDPYRDSSEASVITSPTGGGGDAMSVVSGGRSIYTTDTNATGASSWSVRSRKRPKGAAKKRIHEDQTTDQKKSAGWVETIQAVAEKTNQVWDPKRGWVNYSDPEQPEYEQETERIGPLKPPISVKSFDDSVTEEDNKSQSSYIPFPSRWEKERDAMINNLDFISVTESEVTPRHTNTPKLTIKPGLMNKSGSFRKERNSEPLLNLEEETEEDLDDMYTMGANTNTRSSIRSIADNTMDLVGEQNMKASISSIEKSPSEHYTVDNADPQSGMMDTKGLYEWIDHNGKQRSFENKVYEKRHDTCDSEAMSDAISQPDSVEMNRLETKSIVKSVDEKQLIYDFRGMRIKEVTPETDLSREAVRLNGTTSPFDPLASNHSDTKSYNKQERGDARGMKLDKNGDNVVNTNHQRSKKASLDDNNFRNESLEDRNEDDELFIQDSNSYFGEDNSESRVLQSGSFENGFRVIKSTRNMSDFINNGHQSKTTLPSKNRMVESDSRSITSQNSETLDKAQEWRRKLESKMKTGNNAQVPVTIRPADKAVTNIDAVGPIFVAAADDSSTFDFPKQNQRADTQLVFKKTNVEMQRKAPSSSAQPKNVPINSIDTHKIKSVNIHKTQSLSNDFSSMSSGTKDQYKNHGQNFGVDSILSRLQACASDSTGAPNSMDFCPNTSSKTHGSDRSNEQELPQAHLDFMLSSRMKAPTEKSLTNSSLLVSFCGRPDTIFEEEDEAQRARDISISKAKASEVWNIDRNKSNERHPQTEPTAASFVIESNMHDLATQPQTSIPRSKSEKWQQFMEKRTGSNASISSRKSSASDISKAAEKFAAKKVEEIMNEFNNDVKNPTDKVTRSRSAKAAEDLAAARVQAMLMSNRNAE